MTKQPFDFLVVLDFEATCDDKNPPSPQEVIEFPSVLVSTKTLSVIDQFSTFVKPVHHPKLTDFCTELTSITQEQLDPAPRFPEVLDRHLAWLESHGLSSTGEETGPSFAIVLCGDWDLSTMFPAQCQACDPPIEFIPHPYRQWINIKRPFADHMGWRKAPGMAGMLKAFKLKLEGRHHRGIDDCHNIAKLALSLIERGVSLEQTSQLAPSRYPPVTITLQRGEEQKQVLLKKRSRPALLGLAREAFRCNITKLIDESGTPIQDDTPLFDLVSHSTLQVAL